MLTLIMLAGWSWCLWVVFAAFGCVGIMVVIGLLLLLGVGA